MSPFRSASGYRRVRKCMGKVAAVALSAALFCTSPAAMAASGFLGGDVRAMQSVGDDADWGRGTLTAPPTGRTAQRRGAALLALGLLRSATAVMHLVFSNPKRCGPQKRLDWSPRSCRNLKRYGIAGLGLSAAFVLGGAFELGRGLSLKRRHDRWKRTHWDSYGHWGDDGGPAVTRLHLGPGER